MDLERKQQQHLNGAVTKRPTSGAVKMEMHEKYAKMQSKIEDRRNRMEEMDESTAGYTKQD